MLALSCVRDRIVQHALASALSSHFDSALHPSAFAWRRGRSTRDALVAVDHALADGRQWVFRGDIEEFFDRIPPSLLLRGLQDLTADNDLVALIETLPSAGALLGGRTRCAIPMAVRVAVIGEPRGHAILPSRSGDP